MTQDLADSIKRLPLVYKFRICPLGGDNIEVENNQWFCHAKDVEALNKQAKVTLNQLVELVAEMRNANGMDAWLKARTKADALLTKLGGV